MIRARASLGLTKLRRRAALAAVCRSAGLDPAGAELLNDSINVVYRLTTAPVVVRLRRDTARAAVTRQVTLARWLADAGAPVSRLLETAQPVTARGYVATFWESADAPEVDWRVEHLGVALRDLHALGDHEDLPEWAPFTTLRTRIGRPDLPAGLTAGDRRWLAREVATLEQSYAEVAPTLRLGVLHGDAHIGNLLRSVDGRPVLCDLDQVARGPQLQDLVPTAVNAARFGFKRRQRALVHAYGLDVTRHEAWPVLRRVRELSTTTYGLLKAGHAPRFRDQAFHRLRTLQDGDDATRWGPYG
ncbi:phosphotransferase enzyme family protein [Georgenia alba]|uniref:Phosphotransferase enzyme family protein n=1 Tax=Georgenia alba TaxID=2233858 RepID=A0ABW2Q5L3_9MICO